MDDGIIAKATVATYQNRALFNTQGAQYVKALRRRRWPG